MKEARSETTYTLKLSALPQEAQRQEAKLSQALSEALRAHRPAAVAGTQRRLAALRRQEHPFLVGSRRVRLSVGRAKAVQLPESLSAQELQRLRGLGVEVELRVPVRIELPTTSAGPPSVVQNLPDGTAQAFQRGGAAVELELAQSAVPAWQAAGFEVTLLQSDEEPAEDRASEDGAPKGRSRGKKENAA